MNAREFAKIQSQVNIACAGKIFRQAGGQSTSWSVAGDSKTRREIFSFKFPRKPGCFFDLVGKLRTYLPSIQDCKCRHTLQYVLLPGYYNPTYGGETQCSVGPRLVHDVAFLSRREVYHQECLRAPIALKFPEPAYYRDLRRITSSGSKRALLF